MNVLVASGYCGARACPKILVVTCRVLAAGEMGKEKHSKHGCTLFDSHFLPQAAVSALRDAPTP